MKKALRLLLPLILFSLKIFSQSNFEISFGTASYDVGNVVQQTFDGKYIVTGMTESTMTGLSDLYISLIDTDGTVLWTKSYGGNMNEEGYAVRQTNDSEFVIVGITGSYGSGSLDVYLVKIDMNGDTLWTKTFGGSSNEKGFAMQTTLDSGIIIAGEENSTIPGTTQIYMIKTNLNGDTSWTKSHPFDNWASAKEIVQTPDSGYFVFGEFANSNSTQSDYDLICIKTNSQGDTLWTKSYVDSSYYDFAQAMSKTSDGGFVLINRRFDINTFAENSKIIRLDINGDTIFSKIFNLPGNSSAGIRDICQTSDSGFFITGTATDTILYNSNLFITKINSLGDPLWTKYYHGLYSADGNSIELTSDSGMVICGRTNDSLMNQPDVLVLKVNSDGNIYTCQPSILSQPSDTLMYENHNAAFAISTASQPLSYQWQTDSIGTFVDIHDGAVFSGTNTDTLWITAATLLMDGDQFRCFVTDSFGCPDTSNSATIFVNSSIGISEITSSHYTIYPNPASKNISIDGPTPELVVLYDVFGKIISEIKNEQKIDISFLSNGVYILKIYTKNNNVDVIRFLRN